jgi:hypothetical protein
MTEIKLWSFIMGCIAEVETDFGVGIEVSPGTSIIEDSVLDPAEYFRAIQELKPNASPDKQSLFDAKAPEISAKHFVALLRVCLPEGLSAADISENPLHKRRVQTLMGRFVFTLAERELGVATDLMLHHVLNEQSPNPTYH